MRNTDDCISVLLNFFKEILKQYRIKKTNKQTKQNKKQKQKKKKRKRKRKKC